MSFRFSGEADQTPTEEIAFYFLILGYDVDTDVDGNDWLTGTNDAQRWQVLAQMFFPFPDVDDEVVVCFLELTEPGNAPRSYSIFAFEVQFERILPRAEHTKNIDH